MQDKLRPSNYINLIRKVTKTVGFSDVETSKAGDEATPDLEEAASGLLKDNDWAGVLMDKHDIMFVSESNTDVNNTKQYGALSVKLLFRDCLYLAIVGDTNTSADLATAIHEK